MRAADRRRHDGAVVRRGESGEVAPGAHDVVLSRPFCSPNFCPITSPFIPIFTGSSTATTTRFSEQPVKKLRASFSRPSLEEILEYRRYVDAAMAELIDGGMPDEAARRVTLGLHHEQQHQELLAYDIKNAFWSNPLHPAYREGTLPEAGAVHRSRGLGMRAAWWRLAMAATVFVFDNEQPRHKVYLKPFELASRLVTCGEYLNFMRDGGYERAELWLSDGWEAVKAQAWRAPLYWFEAEGQWRCLRCAERSIWIGFCRARCAM